MAPYTPPIAPDDPSATDSETLATVTVTDTDGNVTRIPNIKSFSYSSDVLAVGDQSSVIIPDPRRLYLDKTKRGTRVELSLSNPLVQGGAETKKLVGRIWEQDINSSSSGGTVITLTIRDLGVHLFDEPPIWTNLFHATFRDFLEKSIDPSWGFQGVRPTTGNDASRFLRQSLPNSRQNAVLTRNKTDLVPFIVIQTEPGQKIYDILVEYCKRAGYLVNVSPDGWIEFFKPNDIQAPQYRLEYHDPDIDGAAAAARNNVLDPPGAHVVNSADPLYTDVTCISEVVTPDMIQEAAQSVDPNFNKIVSQAPHGIYLSLLPFRKYAAFVDMNQITQDQVNARAAWKSGMGQFQSFTLSVTVRGHQQGGIWWEADTMASVEMPVVGISTPLYVQAVRCDRDDAGDRTALTLRLPGLLNA